MNVKKILIFSLAYYPHVGGAEVAIKEITDRISDIEFHMVTLRFSAADAPQEKLGNLVVHRIGGPKWWYPVGAALKARALDKRQHFDGAWAMMSYMALPALFFGLPYALTLQDGDTEGHVFGRLRILPFLPLLRLGFKNARAMSALSTFLAEWGRKQGFRGTVEVIPNGADVQKFAGEKIAHDGAVIITTSRLVHKNAVDDVLRALVLVPDVRFQIAGAGPEETTLKVLARELGVSDRVDWLGHVDHTQLVALLHAADIYVRPSRSEGFGASFPEAMAAEIPVITTQEGGLKDYITPEVAWPVEKDRPDQIALQIKAILGNPQRTAQVVESARQMVVAKYDWSLIARDMRERVFARLFI